MATKDRRAGRDRWIDNPPRGVSRALRPGELWAYRELVAFLALRDVTVRYKQATFGIAWALVKPLSGALVITFVFQRVARVPSEGIPYLAFAFLGYAVWSYFSTTLDAVTSSLVANSGLVTKVYFPRLAAPLAAVLPGLVDFGIALLAAAVLMTVLGVTPGLAVLTLPLWVVAAAVVTFGAGLLLATANVQYRDAHHAYGLLIQLLFFASPVAYSSTLVPAGWQYVYHLNPMAGVLEGFRWSMLGAAAPGRAALVSLAVGLALLAAGVAYFASAERRFADVI